jgi:hypothetical protein
VRDVGKAAARIACVIAFAASMSFFAASAKAATINWTLTGVTFNGTFGADDNNASSTAYGTFSIDTVTGYVTALDISTTLYDLGFGQTVVYPYLLPYVVPVYDFYAPNSLLLKENTIHGSWLHLQFTYPLNIPRAFNPLVPGNIRFFEPTLGIEGSWECPVDPNGCQIIARNITGGGVSTVVPVPTALPLFASGLSLLAWGARRRRKAA